MTQIHQALSHYWHLRDQGLSPEVARLHTRQRFGVEIDSDTPLASTSQVVRTLFQVGDVLEGGYLHGRALVLRDDGGGWFLLRFEDDSEGSFDLSPHPLYGEIKVVESVAGTDFPETIRGCSTDGRQGP